MNLNNQKAKRKAGALNGKIWAADDCWEAENEIIHAIEISEIFPESIIGDGKIRMIGKQFLEKWPGIIKDADENILRKSYLNEKFL